jgi:hypothetical protein
MLKILVGTPTPGEFVTITYVESLLGLQSALGARAEIRTRYFRSADLPFTRNVMANQVLRDGSFTHLLFVDSDMGFRPSLIEKMLAFDRPIVGTCPPSRMGTDDFVGRPLEPPVVDGEFMRMWLVGTGILLIRRDALELYSKSFPDLWTKGTAKPYDRDFDGPIFQFFSRSRQRTTNVSMSEDYSFILRWVNIGGEVWACVTEPIKHVGNVIFEAAFRPDLTIPNGDATRTPSPSPASQPREGSATRPSALPADPAKP